VEIGFYIYIFLRNPRIVKTIYMFSSIKNLFYRLLLIIN